MAQPLPKAIIVAPGVSLPVVEERVNGALGYTSNEHIAIERDQHPVGKHHILFHEMVHVACEKLKAAGLVKRQPSEEFVSNLAGALWPMLAASGLWNGVEPGEALEWAMQEEI